MKTQARLARRVCVLSLIIASSAMAENRDFTDTQGRKLSGEIVAVAAGQVQIKRAADGKLFALPVTQLSAADQKFIGEYAAANVKFSFETKYAKSKLGVAKSKQDEVAVEETRWAYKVALRNLSAVDADDVRVDYWLFRRIDDGLNKSAPRVDVTGSVKSTTIKKGATYEFTTEPVTLSKSQLDAGFIYNDGTKSKSADSLGGLALRIFKGDKEIYSYATDKDLLGAARGTAAMKSAADESK